VILSGWKPEVAVDIACLAETQEKDLLFSVEYLFRHRRRVPVVQVEKVQVEKVQVEKRSAHVSPAGCLEDGACFVEPVEAREAIGLQDATIVLQVMCRMFALAIRRVSEPDSRCRFASRRPVIANADPQAAVFVLPLPGSSTDLGVHLPTAGRSACAGA